MQHGTTTSSMIHYSKHSILRSDEDMTELPNETQPQQQSVDTEGTRRPSPHQHRHPVMIRRREKRRHVSSASVDMRDPLEVLSLAIRLDEATGNAALLEAPLEDGGRLYASQDTFLIAMAYLEDQTKPLSRTRSGHASAKNWSGSRRPALTPIILSGLIAGQLALQQESITTTTTHTTLPSPSEMLLFCDTGRRQALNRINSRRRRAYMRNMTIVCCLVGLLVGSHYQAMARVQTALMELGYVGLVQTPDYLTRNCTTNNNNNNNNNQLEEILGLQPCETFATRGYETACRVAEARLWAFTKDYALPYSSQHRQCNYNRCGATDGRSIIRHQLSNLPGRAQEFPLGHAPYAMHTVAVREETILDQKNNRRKHTNARHGELGWLGDSLVNRRTRAAMEELAEDRTQNDITIRVLDVGCGIGGMMYALLPFEQRGKTRRSNLHYDYTGISLAASEIQNARLLRDEHKVDPSRARFLQMSFDDARLPDTGPYDAIVATEVLSFSTNITATLTNLVRSLHHGGSLIIHEDVVHGPRRARPAENSDRNLQSRMNEFSELTARPSLYTHAQWMDLFKEFNLEVVRATDWGLHDKLPLLVTEDQEKSFHLWDWMLRLRVVLLSWTERWDAWNPLLRQDIIHNLLQRWEDWKWHAVSAGVSAGAPFGKYRLKAMAAVRTVQLIRGDARVSRADQLRSQAHERVDLTYNMYVSKRSDDDT